MLTYICIAFYTEGGLWQRFYVIGILMTLTFMIVVPWKDYSIIYMDGMEENVDKLMGKHVL